jgi:hypothetical protein
MAFTYSEANSVKEVLVVSDVGVLLSDLSASLEEHAVGHLHNSGLVDGGDPVSAADLGVVEGVSGDSLRRLVGNELDRLDDSGNELVLNTTVLSLGVLSDEDGVNVVVGRLESLNGGARSYVGEQVEGSSEGEVERDVSLSDGGGERSLEGDSVLLDGSNGIVGDLGLAVDEDGGNLDLLPLDGSLQHQGDKRIAKPSACGRHNEQSSNAAHLGLGEDLLDRLSDLRSDTWGRGREGTPREASRSVLRERGSTRKRRKTYRLQE